MWNAAARCCSTSALDEHALGREETVTVARARTRSQRKTGQSVKFELTEQTRQTVDDYLTAAGKKPGEFLFAGRRSSKRSMTTRQYARLLDRWLTMIDLEPRAYGTHSLRRTKVALVYRRIAAIGRPHLVAAPAQVSDEMAPDESAGAENGELGHSHPHGRCMALPPPIRRQAAAYLSIRDMLALAVERDYPVL